MNEYLLFKFLHLLAFVYWLGGDLGTFLASRQVVREDLPPQSRAVALNIMLACDQGPKLAMPLVLALGVHLSWLGGWIAMPVWLPVLVWLLAAWWFGNVLYLYLREGAGAPQWLARLDLALRVLVIAVIAVYVLLVLLAVVSAPGWLVAKLAIFALLVACGVAIRLHLRPFGPAFGQLMKEGPSDAANRAIADSISRCRPFVWVIWGGLFAAAALGMHLF